MILIFVIAEFKIQYYIIVSPHIQTNNKIHKELIKQLQCMHQSNKIHERLLMTWYIHFYTTTYIIKYYIYTLECKRCFQLKAKIANDIKYCFFFVIYSMQVFANKEATFSLINKKKNWLLSDNELKC